MQPLKRICVAGVAAAALLGSVPAMAQVVYDSPYDGYDPYAGTPVYGGYVREVAPRYAPYPAFYGGGYYSPHQETYIGPYGYAHRRCRPHRACYEGYGYGD
jgi:hypothetical protein